MTTHIDRPAFDTPTMPLRKVDNGFFGPDSPTWKVWTSPTALIGFQRAVTLEHFDPALTASVADVGGIYTDPYGRLDHTFAYFLVVAVGDSRMAVTASDHLLKVHAQSTGVDPITGRRYSANNPDSQLWIHVTGWHSVLKCYEMYGPGRLTAEEEERYWADCVIAAELQTCRPSDVPTNRDEVREYFEAVRSGLCVSERAHRGMHYLLHTPIDRGPRVWASSRIVAPAAIATLPKWMRTVGGFDHSAIVDAAYPPAVRAAVGLLRRDPQLTSRLVRRAIGPMTGALYAQHLSSPSPDSAATPTVAHAREIYRSSRGPAPENGVPVA
ncbi:DUF2236 domain-containing protein [Gordonia sp. PDNC005]|uniref:oxygenase MpaB family protein n=1 Tax=unclassified Gordonia (in: high G+C Gram-positive bacteria) TaxID=2657482 RepID=UPI001964DE68|nr:oxygenase MpaB family protein [Gordonia sp. PDNC005]QRY62384.1 DUF2236 domain-containing protein [Gordonia sp. PDNC005]